MTSRDDYEAVKTSAHTYAADLAATGTDPGEALIRGFGRASGEAHMARCPNHSADTCVDLPPDQPDARPRGWVL